jgi:hypothetical protein
LGAPRELRGDTTQKPEPLFDFVGLESNLKPGDIARDLIRSFLTNDSVIYVGTLANCPHKLTKTAGPLARRSAASGGANCTRAARRLQFAPAAAR